jgi:hypothetical protein
MSLFGGFGTEAIKKRPFGRDIFDNTPSIIEKN